MSNKGATMNDETRDATVEGRPAKREKHATAQLQMQLPPEVQKQFEEMQKRQKQFEEMQKRLAELEAKAEAIRKENEEIRKETEEIRKENEELKKILLPIKEIARTGLLNPPRNESGSSAHTNTGHRPAKVNQTLDLPDELGRADKFWNCRREAPEFADAINSEASSRYVVQTVLTFIMGPLSKHLGFQIMDVLSIHACVSLLDTIPDLSLLGPNKIIGSSVEIKKDPRVSETMMNQIYGTDTEVQGEVYEQLYLVDCNNLGSGSVGLVSTAEHYALVSLDEDISYDIEEIKKFFSGGKGKTESTPDRMQTAIFKSEDLPATKTKKFRVKAQGATVSIPDEYIKKDKHGNIKKNKKTGKNETYKYGRVAAIASQKSADYSHYTSKVLSMRKDPEGTLNLLAVFVILTLRNLMRYIENTNQNKIMTMTEFTARFVHEPDVFCLTAVTLSRPIDFLRPTKSCNGSKFYAIRQLDFGSHGVCCLAFNNDGYACVLKLIHMKIIETHGPEKMAEEAKEEAAMWRKIYRKNYHITAKFLKVNDRLIIVMPYLQIPSTHADKRALCKGGKSSKLYRGLKEFCDAGYTHDDLCWHHVGEIPSNDPDCDNPCLLCDLGNISQHAMSEGGKGQWVNEAFTKLENRLDTAQKKCLQTPKK